MASRDLNSRMTIEQFERLPEENEYTLELVDGLVVREPRPGYGHGVVHTRLAELLSAHVRKQRLGVVLVETGYVLDVGKPTVRGPDISFISAARLPEMVQRKSFPRMAPDLAVEILSPSETTRAIQRKVKEYLAAGVREVWVLDPRTRRAWTYVPGAPACLVQPDGILAGGSVFPGLLISLGELFGTPHAAG